MIFTEVEVRVLWENVILVPPVWHLQHGWNVSAAGYAVPSIPGFYNLLNFRWFWERRFGAAAVGARRQNFGRACRCPQNAQSGALPATILGAPMEML
jgi:hypothetical protein